MRLSFSEGAIKKSLFTMGSWRRVLFFLFLGLFVSHNGFHLYDLMRGVQPNNFIKWPLAQAVAQSPMVFDRVVPFFMRHQFELFYDHDVVTISGQKALLSQRSYFEKLIFVKWFCYPRKSEAERLLLETYFCKPNAWLASWTPDRVTPPSRVVWTVRTPAQRKLFVTQVECKH